MIDNGGEKIPEGLERQRYENKQGKGASAEVLNYTFRLDWSEDDGEWVGLCDQYKYLSFLNTDKSKAIAGIMRLVADII